jgi:hypothetical protein
MIGIKMTNKPRTDYRVYEEITTQGKTLWRIRSGGKRGDIITSCNSVDEANEISVQLNIDPWFLYRGQTRRDALARHAKDAK